MPSSARHRETLLVAAARLFRRQGYAATGLSEILSSSGAPRGSLYHYFPAGKVQIGEEVVARGGALVTDTIEEIHRVVARPGAVILEYGRRLAGWLEASAFRDGSPITTTLLELAPQHAGVTAEGRKAIRSMVGALEHVLTESGVPDGRARSLATVAVAAFDGALVQTRVELDAGPVLTVAAELALLFDRACDEH